MVPGLLALLMTASIDGTQVPASAVCADSKLAVTVQIHDYARVSGESLAGASDIVTSVYRKVGVLTEWFGVVRQFERRGHSARDRETSSTSGAPIAQFTIIVLTEQMAARGRFPSDALGLAAVSATGWGRIAYVVYDRVRQTAAATGISEVQLLGFVMSHEIAHLLQVPGSDSNAGLMKSHWERRDLKRIDVPELEFSPREARQLREGLQRGPDALAARANRLASNGVESQGPEVCSR